MHSLRQTKFIARLMLVWFVFSIGIASASPLVSPKAMELVCSSGGVMKLVSSDSNNADKHDNIMPDCAMCMLAALPAVPASTTHNTAGVSSHTLRPIAAAHIPSATAPPLPSRGPPAF